MKTIKFIGGLILAMLMMASVAQAAVVTASSNPANSPANPIFWLASLRFSRVICFIRAANFLSSHFSDNFVSFMYCSEKPIGIFINGKPFFAKNFINNGIHINNAVFIFSQYKIRLWNGNTILPLHPFKFFFANIEFQDCIIKTAPKNRLSPY